MTGDTYGVNPHTPDAPGRPRPEPQNRGITYDGKTGRLFGMGLKIAILSLITLGFYRFWGKTEIRRYLASRVGVRGDRFEYTGTGRELFLGFLIALAALIPLGAASYGIELVVAGKSGVLQIAAMVLQYAIILLLIGYATFRARRYRLSRTVLRGIRFWQTGSNVGYAFRMMGYLALTFVTLGIARPVGDIALHRYQMQHTWFGSRQFEFDGHAGAMMGKWVLSLLLAPFTLGLSLLWYAAFRMRYLQSQTRYQGMGFALPLTFGDLTRIYGAYVLAMMLLIAVTFGAYYYVTVMPAFLQDPPLTWQEYVQNNDMVRHGAYFVMAFVAFGLVAPVLKLVLLTHRFVGLVARRLEFIGDVNLDAIMQNAAQRPESGEGLADAFDVGGGLEVGL